MMLRFFRWRRREGEDLVDLEEFLEPYNHGTQEEGQSPPRPTLFDQDREDQRGGAGTT